MEQNRRWGLSRLYQFAITAYSAVPYRLLRSGYAFPAWHYFLEVTRRCNLRCAMCQYSLWYQKTPPADQTTGELSTQEWRAVIDQTGRFSLLTFTGGEPWVREDFLSLLEYASAKRRTHVITNGTRLTPEAARRCVKLAPKRLGGRGLNFMGISLEGPRELHDRIVRQKGAFDRTIEGLKTLVKDRTTSRKRCPIIHLTVVIQKENLEALPQMPSIAAEAGADVLNLEIEIRFHDLPGLGEELPSAHSISAVSLPRIDPKALHEALEATLRAAQHSGLEVRWPRMPREEMIRYYDGGIDVHHFRCRAAWSTLYVGAKGDAFPCFIYRVGNIREQPLKAIWNGSRMRRFRQYCRRRPFDICQGCCHLEYDAARVSAHDAQTGNAAGGDEPQKPCGGEPQKPCGGGNRDAR